VSGVWISAWLISLLSAGLACWCARKEGAAWTEAVLFAVAFFPAPLFVAIGGGNSFVYLSDLTVPVMVWLTWRRWRFVPAPARRIALWIVLGAGIIPFLVCAGFAERKDLLFAAINLYRLVGAMCLMSVMSSAVLMQQPKGEHILLAFSLINVVLIMAMLLQGYGIMDSNLFYGVSDTAHEQVRFIAAGLFRGSLGMVGALGIISYLARRGTDAPFNLSRTIVSVAGAIAGGSIIILSGSKSSLVAIVLLIGICAFFHRWIRHFWPKTLAFVFLTTTLCVAYFPKLGDSYLSYTLGTLSLQEDSLQTFTGRQQTWREGFDLISSSPSILIGLPTSKVEELNTAYYHNEFIGLLMVGGIFSVGAYLIGTWLLGRGLFRNRSEAQAPRVFAALVWLTGILHAATVNHLTPGILYSCTVSLFAAAYGFGLNPSLSPKLSTKLPLATPPVPSPSSLIPRPAGMIAEIAVTDHRAPIATA
jgi:hypothetical protein